MNYTKRQHRLIKLLESKTLDAILVRKRHNISYLTGIKGEDSILFVSGRGNFLITDSRFKEEYAKGIKNCRLRIVEDEDVYACIENISKETRSRHIGFESGSFAYSEYVDLKKKLKDRVFMPLRETVESLRMIKDKDELKCIREACKYGCSIMDYALKTVRPSVSERVVKNRVEGYIREKGVKRADFDIIVASGKNASMPHAPASEKNIKSGEMVIIDLGAMNYGYNSDLTRTIFLGKIDRKYRRIYNIVSDAHKKAIEHIKPGINAKYIDNICREYISDKGLGRYFIHGLGHGIGLEIHEKPRISRNNNTVLEKNMTITIEPGVYVPGWGGVRIEDVVLITRDGHEILTRRCKKDYADRDKSGKERF